MTVNDLSSDDLRKRIDEINKMLIEVASGNFTYKIERSDKDDELEGLVVGYNMMVEELRAKFNRKYTDLEHKNVTTMAFIVNDDLIVECCDISAEKTLLCSSTDIIGKPLENIVTAESKLALDMLRSRMLTSQRYVHTAELFFKTKEAFIVQADCSISPLATGGSFLITAIETITEPMGEPGPEERQDLLDQYNSESEEELAFKLIMRTENFREADYNKLHEARKMITLKSQWSLGLLADKVGIEKRTLAKLFRQLNGKSLTDYVVEERMKEAKKLLRNPDLQLKEIAHKIGYKNASTFSQIFKKQVGCSPSEYRQLDLDGN